MRHPTDFVPFCQVVVQIRNIIYYSLRTSVMIQFEYKETERTAQLNPEAMKPHGLALLDYHNGNLDTTLAIYRDDGWRDELPVKTFFRRAEEYELEKIALGLCRGCALDVGAGTGLHSLFLQGKGLSGCAIDVLSEAVQIMRGRGVVNIR